MRMRKFLLICALPFLLAACANIDMDCPQTGGETIAIGGSTVGSQVLALGLAAGQTALKGGMLAAAAAPEAKLVQHVHYSYVPLFGSDFVACQRVQPAPTTPTPLNVTVMMPQPTSTSPPTQTR